MFRGFCARTPLGGRIRCAASEAVGDPGFWDGLAIIGGQLDAADAAARAAGRLSRQKLARSTAWSTPNPYDAAPDTRARTPDRRDL